MKRHPAWLAVGLLIFVVLACSFSKKIGTTNSNSNSTSPAATAENGPGDMISEIHMAKDDDGSPGAESDTFDPGDRKIHCVTTLKEPKAGTQMKFAWWIVDADGRKNEKVKEIDYKTKAIDRVVHGHLVLPIDWPKGKYKVMVYVDGNLDRTAFFTVQ